MNLLHPHLLVAMTIEFQCLWKWMNTPRRKRKEDKDEGKASFYIPISHIILIVLSSFIDIQSPMYTVQYASKNVGTSRKMCVPGLKELVWSLRNEENASFL